MRSQLPIFFFPVVDLILEVETRHELLKRLPHKRVKTVVLDNPYNGVSIISYPVRGGNDNIVYEAESDGILEILGAVITNLVTAIL